MTKQQKCRKIFFLKKKLAYLQLCQRFHGVMVSTQDSESCDPSSNLGGTSAPVLFI